MNKLRKARYLNILKKAAKINRLIKKGYLVFDHYDDRSDGFKFNNGILYQGDNQCKIVWVGKDGSGWDSALDIPIKKYNADHFDKWTAVHPKDIKKI
jgi:hypothetical protein